MMRLRPIAVFRWSPPIVLFLALALVGCGEGPPAKPPERPFAGMKLIVGVVGEPGPPPLDQGPTRRVGRADRRRADRPGRAGRARGRLEVGRRCPGLPRRPVGRPRRRQGPGHPARLDHPPGRVDLRGEQPGPRPADRRPEAQGPRARLPRPGDEVRTRPGDLADRRIGPGHRLPAARLRQPEQQGSGQGPGPGAGAPQDLGAVRRPGPVLPRSRLGRRWLARVRPGDGLGRRSRGGRRRRRSWPGPPRSGSTPTSSRSCSTPRRPPPGSPPPPSSRR